MTDKEKIRAEIVRINEYSHSDVLTSLISFIDSLQEDSAPLTEENSTPLSGGGRADASLQDPKKRMCKEPVGEKKPIFKQGDILYNKDDGSKIEIIDIVADQYKFECGDEYPHYEFFGYIEHNYSKEPVSEDLETEIEKYLNALYSGWTTEEREKDSLVEEMCRKTALHFANWQKLQMISK